MQMFSFDKYFQNFLGQMRSDGKPPGTNFIYKTRFGWISYEMFRIQLNHFWSFFAVVIRYNVSLVTYDYVIHIESSRRKDGFLLETQV